MTLVLQQAGQDLFEGALPVEEPEAVLRWDRIQLAVGELGDPAEGVAGGSELLGHDVNVDVLGGVLVLVLAGTGSIFGVVRGSVTHGAKEPRDAMTARLGWSVRA